MVELNPFDETDFQDLVAQLRGLERQFVEIRTEMSQLAGLEAILGNFKDLSQPLLFFTTGTEKVKGVIGTMPVDQISRLELAFSSQVARDGELFVKVTDPAKDKDAKVALLYLRELDEKVSVLCAEVSFNRIELPRELSGTALEEIARIGERKTLFLEREEVLTLEAGRLSGEWLDRVQALSDFWTVMKGATKPSIRVKVRSRSISSGSGPPLIPCQRSRRNSNRSIPFPTGR